MNSKQRLKATLNHIQPDKVVVDFGSTAVTGIHVLILHKLRKIYGLPEKPIVVNEPYQMLGEVDEELIRQMGIDTCSIVARTNLFGFENKNLKEFVTPWGQQVLVPEMFITNKDEHGDLVIYPEGDVSVPPSGKMPESGYFFDTIIRQNPIVEEQLNPEDNTEEFELMTNEDMVYWKEQIENYKTKQSDKGLVVGIGGTAFGDIALVPGPFMKNPKGIRDITEWYMSTIMRPDYIHAIFEKQAEIALKNLSTLHSIAGNEIDAIFICGTDFGTQDSLFCSPETFDEMYKPYYKLVNKWIHEHTTWKTFKHSCGSILPLMPNFIDAGFDIINPVQINARDMDSKVLKERFGDQITFWGGGVDTQKVLAFGTPAEVEEQVKQQCDVFSKNGGFVFNAVHNVQANVPIQNVEAMIRGVKSFNGEL